MALSEERRNEIAWQYLLSRIQQSDLRHTNFDSADTRQKIRVTAEELDIPFEEALEFVRELLKRSWYRKAVIKMKAFLPKLDEDLMVEAGEVTMPEAPYKGLALCFSHLTNPQIRWIMTIQENDYYIEHELPSIVESTFREKHGL